MNENDLLREQIRNLGPWHLEVQVTPEISTRVWTDVDTSTETEQIGPVSFLDPRPSFVAEINRVYPEGLAGRSFLDCACNCGAYSFLAKELGAGNCCGFDVRDHWIKQADFLLKHRTVGPKDGLHFEVCDLYDLPKKGLAPFDVTIFKGIFYHLPDPIAGLKIASDLTSELMILNTATRTDLPDGLLAIQDESRETVMSGVYGLCWYPTGPKVLTQLLQWAGFVEIHVLWSHREKDSSAGRIELLASKKPGLLDSFRKQRSDEDQ